MLRIKMGWTQIQLAQKSKLKQNTISALEHNRIKLGLERAKMLVIVFKVHPGLIAFPGWATAKNLSNQHEPNLGIPSQHPI